LNTNTKKTHTYKDKLTHGTAQHITAQHKAFYANRKGALCKLKIEKHMHVHAGQCMRTMSRPRHVSSERTTLKAPTSRTHKPPLFLDILSISHMKRCTQLVASSAKWHLRARRTLIRTNKHIGIHACSKQLPNNQIHQPRRRQRQGRSELLYHTSTQEHKVDATHVGAAGNESAGDASWLFWMMRDSSNCSGIRHSEKVSIKESRKMPNALA
jgi:hypothetical protein